MTGRWRPTSLVTEGLRNTAVGGVRALLVVGAVAATLTAAIAADMVEAVNLRTAETQAWHDGSHVTVVTADQGIDARRCDRLATQREVLAAGAVRVPREQHLTRLGASGVGVVEVTSGVVDLLEILGDNHLDRAFPDPWAIVPSTTSDSLGLQAGEHVELDTTTTVTLTDVVDTSLLTNQFSTGLLSEVTPQRGFDGCLLLAAPNDWPDVRDILAATVATTEQWQATELQAPGGRFADLDADWQTRTTRLLAPAAALAAVAVWAALLAGRRNEAGLYRSLGLTANHVTVIRLVEFTVLAFFGTAAAILGVAALAMLAGWPTDILTTNTFRSTGLFLGLTATTAPLTARLLSAGQGLELVKDT